MFHEKADNFETVVASLGDNVICRIDDGVGISTKYVTDESIASLLDYIVINNKLKVISLSLTESSLTKQGIESITKTCGHTLQSLDLSDNPLQDDDIVSIYELKETLKELAVERNFLTHDCIKKLSDTLNLEFLSTEPQSTPPVKQSLMPNQNVITAHFDSKRKSSANEVTGASTHPKSTIKPFFK